MTDRPHVAPRDLLRWPADPAELIDTTLCPACFSPLSSTRCGECELDLGVPAAGELFALSMRMHAEAERREELMTRMRVAQAAAAHERRPLSRRPCRSRSCRSAAESWAPIVGAEQVAPDVAAAAVVVDAPASTTAVGASAFGTPAGSDETMPPPPVASDTEAVPRSSRSGVQVLLLTLGVVLISITAIVFLFVAYLVASLEVRSVIIAGASVLVLAVAWLLRARRLPGTAEGVASVAIVLLLLDVWIVRANALFGTDRLDAAGYSGGALLVVAGLLAATRAVSGIRVAGIAAAALLPVAVFLLAFAVAPDGEVATGVWLGSLAASLVGSAALLTPPRIERTIVVVAGIAASVLGTVAASWALPELAWHELWTFSAVAAAWLIGLVVLHVRGAGVSPVWGRIAAPAFGVSAALAPSVALLSELEPSLAIWLVPAAAGLVTCVFAAIARLRPSVGSDALAACAGSGAVALVAASPGAYVGIVEIGSRAGASIPAWAQSAVSPSWFGAEYHLGGVLVPILIAAGAFAVLALLGRVRVFAAIPIGAALAGVLVAGAVASEAAVAALILAVLGAGALALAVTLRRAEIPGLTVVLAVVGLSGAALAWTVGYASTAVWPWTTIAVLATAIAGRLLARRVWSADAAAGVGIGHVAVASLLAVFGLASLAPWLEASGAALAAPWTSPWMWLGVGGALLLGLGAIAPIRGAGDRTAFAVPLLIGAFTAVFAVAGDDAAAWRWLPAALFVVAGLAWLLRPSHPVAVRAMFAVATPIALVLGAAVLVAELAGGEFAGYGGAAAVLLAAALAHLVSRRATGAPTIAWIIAVALVGVLALTLGVSTVDESWLVLLILAPVPIVLAALGGDPFGGDAPGRHVSWLSLGLGIAGVWTWLAGEGVVDVAAYTLSLAVALAATGALITWRRPTDERHAAGRTALFGSAAAIAVLPNIGSSGDSELHTLVLSTIGIVVAIAASYLPESAGGVPVRLLGVATGWTAVTGAALVRGSAVATGTQSELPVEFWPIVALVAGVVIAVTWARFGSRPPLIAEAVLAASVASAAVPTTLAIVNDEAPLLRAAVLFPLLAAAHVLGAATPARPFAGPVFSWTTGGLLTLGGFVVLLSGNVDPFDVVIASIGLALIAAGVFAMRRSPELGSWRALGAGLAVLLIPPLLADFADPELWRIVTLGVVAALAVVVGATRRLQAPLLLGGAVLLVHAIAQLWPWITWLYEAVWWWLWLGVAGVLLVVLAATYERQLRLARGTIRTIEALR